MLSLPDNWDFSIKGLVAICPNDGESSIRTGLKRITDAGYLKRYSLKNKQGKIIDWIWEISGESLIPINISDEETAENTSNCNEEEGTKEEEKPVVDFPQLDNPQLENPHVENQGQLNTKQINTKELNTKEYKESNRENLKCQKTSIHKVKKNINSVKKRYRKKFVPPKLDEIQSYIQENGLNVNAKYFFDYYSKLNWVDSLEKKVLSWKQKLLSWNSYSSQKNKYSNTGNSYNNYEQRQYTKEDLERLFVYAKRA